MTGIPNEFKAGNGSSSKGNPVPVRGRSLESYLSIIFMALIFPLLSWMALTLQTNTVEIGIIKANIQTLKESRINTTSDYRLQQLEDQLKELRQRLRSLEDKR